MGHTNSTANIALPQFIGTDKPTWLGDVNGAFSAIDSKVGTIDADVSAVDAKADNAVADAANAVTTATNANNTAGTASTTATNALNVANNALTVANNADGHTNQLETKIGLLADLTTTDKTSIVNAINEVNAAGAPAASAVSYDNTGSGLTAANVQDAIDELAQGGGGSGYVKHDINKTVSSGVNDVLAFIDSNTNDATLRICPSGTTEYIFKLSYAEFSGNTLSYVVFKYTDVTSNTRVFESDLRLKSDGTYSWSTVDINNGTITMSDASAQGNTWSINSISVI